MCEPGATHMNDTTNTKSYDEAFKKSAVEKPFPQPVLCKRGRPPPAPAVAGARRTVDHHHPLRALTPLGFANTKTPFLAGAEAAVQKTFISVELAAGSVRTGRRAWPCEPANQAPRLASKVYPLSAVSRTVGGVKNFHDEQIYSQRCESRRLNFVTDNSTKV
jgi:hypothetical protein